MEEIWKNIEEDPRYQVSSLGRIRGVTGILRKFSTDKKGYRRINIRNDLVKVSPLVHRIVASAFILNPKNLPQINHINCDKTDNRVSNLEWCDNYTNAHHAIDNGLHRILRGSEIGTASDLSDEDVRLIRFLRKKGLPRKQLMSEFGVSIHVIKDIISKRTWTHI